MTNHFHLLVHTARANLSQFMRHFQVTYTVRFNRRSHRSGHIFLRRFKNANVQTKAGHLKKYPWSSFAGYCHLRKRKSGFDYSQLLNSYFGGDDSRGRQQYCQYVLNALGAEIENPFEDVMHQSILGTQEFVKRIKAKLPPEESQVVPASRSLQRNRSIDQVIDTVCRFYGAKAADILDRRTRAKGVRQMAMELCYRHCNLNQRQIGQVFKVDYSTVSVNRRRLKSRLNIDRRLYLKGRC